MDELTIPFLGDRRASWQYPFRSLHAAGATAVRGQRLAGQQPGPALGRARSRQQEPARWRRAGQCDPFLPEQAPRTWPSVLAAYTSGSARVNGLEAATGAIRAGPGR